eukprot:COSAG02_NODE_26846_length_622_cov_1.573614_1_plen_38_part_10
MWLRGGCGLLRRAPARPPRLVSLSSVVLLASLYPAPVL